MVVPIFFCAGLLLFIKGIPCHNPWKLFLRLSLPLWLEYRKWGSRYFLATGQSNAFHALTLKAFSSPKSRASDETDVVSLLKGSSR